MVRPSGEGESQARKEVRFLVEEFEKTAASGTKADTPLRRRSSAIHEEPIAQPDRDEEDDTGPASFERFEREVTTALPTIRYSMKADALNDDLAVKINQLADHFTKKHPDKIPAIPFNPLLDHGKADLFGGTIGSAEFAQIFAEFPDKVFQEVKIRTLAMIAYAQQVAELHTVATDLSRNMVAVHDWVPAIKATIPDNEALLDEVVEKQHEIAALEAAHQEEINTLNQVVTDLNVRNRSTTRHSTCTEGGSGGGRSAKFPDPAIFLNGAKDTVTFEVWYRGLQNKLRTNADHFDNDAARQSYIESRLGGKAASELAPYLRDTHPDQITTSENLMNHLFAQYHDPLVAEKSRDDFDSLLMKIGDNYAEFKNNFVRLAGETGLNKASWKREFKRKIPPTIFRSLVSQYNDATVTFDYFAKLAGDIAHSFKQAPAKSTDNPSANPAKGKSKSNNSDSAAAPRTNRPAKAPVAQLSRDEVRKLYEEGRCLHCKEKGHIARECPARTNTAPNHNVDREARIAALQDRFASTEAVKKAKPTSSKKKLEEVSSSGSDSEN